MPNTLTSVTPQLLAQGLNALRQEAFMPMIVNRAYDSMAGDKGSTITIPVPSALTASDVSPSNTPPSTADHTPSSVNIVMDNWKEAAFYLTDKELMEVMGGHIPGQAQEAVKALANAINQSIFACYKDIYGYVGTAATTPFAIHTTGGVQDTSIPDATNARKTLNKQLAPMDPRFFILDPDAEANASNLRIFQDTNFAISADDVAAGRLSPKLGFLWKGHQLVPTHTAGTLTDGKANAETSAGATAIVIKSTAGGTLVKGDILTFAGHSQTYVVTNSTTVTIGAGSNASVSISPALQATVAADANATKAATHVVNLAFHRDAFAFASRPLSTQTVPGSIVQSISDPLSGLTLRLEISREHKRTRYSFDALWGAQTVRRELATRVAG